MSGKHRKGIERRRVAGREKREVLPAPHLGKQTMYDVVVQWRHGARRTKPEPAGELLHGAQQWPRGNVRGQVRELFNQQLVLEIEFLRPVIWAEHLVGELRERHFPRGSLYREWSSAFQAV